MRAGIPTALDMATNSAVCSLQSPICVRSTSRAEGRLTVGFFCTVALTKRVSASARARVPTAPRTALFRRGTNVGIVAFDERLGRQVPREIGVGRPGRERSAHRRSRRCCRRRADRRPADRATTNPRLRRACEAAARCADRRSAEAAASSLDHGNDRRRLEQVLPDAAVDRERPRPLRRSRAR